MLDEVLEEEVREVDVRGKKHVSGGRAKSIPWNGEDEAFLAKAYFHISIDPKIGDNQKFQSFWQRVANHYNTLQTKHSRSYHQVNTKWKKLQPTLKEFSGIFAKLKHVWASGRDDADILTMALDEWAKNHNNKEFKHRKAWEVVERQEKFQYVPPMGGTFTDGPSRGGTPTGGEDESGGSDKRARTSESGHYRTQLPNLNEDSMPTLLKRKAKNKAESSKTTKESLYESVEQYKLLKLQEKEERKEMKRQEHEVIIEREKLARDLLQYQFEVQQQATKDRELKFYAESHDHLQEPVRSVVVARKREIAEKYDWPYPNP